MLCVDNDIEEIYDVKVFTDASLKTINGKKYVSYGYIIKSSKYDIDEERYYTEENTISYGELNGIYTAIVTLENLMLLGIIPKNAKIALFSDSQYCVNSLNRWVFSWYKRKIDNMYIKPDGSYVAHQNIMNYIIKIVTDNNISINFYHIYSHVNTFPQIQKLKEGLKKGGLNVTTRVAKDIASHNNQVDINSRNKLDAKNPSTKFIEFKCNISDDEMRKYKKLIK